MQYFNRILVVDDEIDGHKNLKELLVGQGYNLVFIDNGYEALAKALEFIPDLILLDIKMPGMNSFEVCQQLRSDPVLGEVPIIMIIDLDNRDFRLQAIEAGADDFISKPFDYIELRARVQSILRLNRYRKLLLERIKFEEITELLPIHDITRGKRVETQIQEQATLFSITREAIFVLDLNGNILFWNKEAERLYGWIAEEVIGKKAAQILFKEHIDQSIEAYNYVIEKGKWNGELQEITKDGNEIIVESRWILMLNKNKEEKNILVVNNDITDKKKLEAHLLRAQRMDNIGALSSGIAHDLNNVLTPVLMSLEILKRNISDSRNYKLLNLMEDSLNRGVELVKQVLSFGRGAENSQTVVQVKHVILEIEKVLKETFSKLIEIQIDVLEELWTVNANITQIHQILMNLCINARDAMSEIGLLRISAYNFVVDQSYVGGNRDAKIGNYVVMSVSDNGSGIASEILDKIFDPFFTTKAIGKGTGLGLSTVISIVKNHGGFIKVNSQVGRGTEFEVFLPAINVEETQGIKESNDASLLGKGELILVVDDEASIREITKTSLETYNYRVLTARDGIEAITLYVEYKEKIALVITDMMMPLLDCSKTIQAFQKINPNVKIIVISGAPSTTKIQELRYLGIKMFLPKPYTLDTLLETLQKILNS